MSIDQNKQTVRRFITEVINGGNVGVVDELLASDYVNPGIGGADRKGFKAALAGMAAAMPQRHITIHELVAEGDSVVARFTYDITLASGEKVKARGLTYYRLANGKIVEDEPITSPDLMPIIMAQMPAQTHA